MGRAEIDSGAPFRSVREAVSLFGQKDIKPPPPKKHGVSYSEDTLEAELRETKERLKIAMEENKLLSEQTKSLTEELQTTKAELRALKSTELHVEDIQCIEKPRDYTSEISDEERFDVEGRRRSVKFASPPLLTKEDSNSNNTNQLIVNKHTKKMKPLVPLAAWLFARNRSH